MFKRSSLPPPRAGINRLELIVVANLILWSTLLLLPACTKARVTEARTQTVNNLKQIGYAAQSYHDGNKRLPINGCDNDMSAMGGANYSTKAQSNNPVSGSWLFQLAPYIDQAVIFNLNGNSTTTGFTTMGIQAYLCPGRGRPSYEDGKGPWSDYFINNYVNDPENADLPDNADRKRTLVGITDGSSFTIFAGHGNIAKTDYAKTKNVAGCSNIFVGGTQGTMRGGPKWVEGSAPRVALQRDSETPAILAAGGWGGPYPQGALMVMCDATVRMVPYATADWIVGAPD